MIALPPLPYSYDALEPHIDKLTVEIHYTKHHKGYYDKLVAALAGYPDLAKKPLLQLLTGLSEVPAEIRTSVRNNGGGLWAHTFFWESMCHNGSLLDPEGNLARAISRDFGSFEAFEKQFKAAAAAVFGSGWTWLVHDTQGKLSIRSTPGHDLPQVDGFEPLLVIDVWEHAYYLKYQNRRPEFIDNWWQLIDWAAVEKRIKT